MKSILARVKVTLAAREFTGKRADWYEYLADMIKDSEGRRTIRDIFESDAARYGSASSRGILSAHWAHRIAETGDIGQTLAGSLPRREVAELAALQRRGQDIFSEGLQDLANLVRLTENLKGILIKTALVGVLAIILLWAVVMLAMPYYTAPELLAAFPRIPPEYYGMPARIFFGLTDWIRANGLWIWIFMGASLALFVLSFSYLDGPVRRRLDKWGPYRLYRDIQAIGVVSIAATSVKTRAGVTVPLRDALESLHQGASRWLSVRIHDMLQRLDDSYEGATIFDVGLMDQDTFWYLQDISDALGLDTALQKTRIRMETRLLKRIEWRAVALRWVLLLTAVAGLLGTLAWHYAVIFDLRNATMLSNF